MDPVTIMKTVGTGLMVGGQLQQGSAIHEAKNFEAKQLEQRGIAEYARGTRQAREAIREGDILASNARAAMAASGGVTTDPQATEQLAGIETEASYNALSALFDAEVDKQALELQAKASRYEGDIAKRESRTKALATILTGAADMWPGFKAPTTPTTTRRRRGRPTGFKYGPMKGQYGPY